MFSGLPTDPAEDSGAVPAGGGDAGAGGGSDVAAGGFSGASPGGVSVFGAGVDGGEEGLLGVTAFSVPVAALPPFDSCGDAGFWVVAVSCPLVAADGYSFS